MKQFQGEHLTGPMLRILLESTVAALNDSVSVSIPDMWSALVAHAADDAFNKVSTSSATGGLDANSLLRPQHDSFV